MKIKMLFIFLLSIPIFALSDKQVDNLLDLFDEENLRSFQHVRKFKEQDWVVMVVADKGSQDRLYVVDYPTRKILYQWSPEEKSARFLRLQVEMIEKQYHPVILSFWTHGSHGEKLQILGSEKGLFQASEFKSTWSIEAEVRPQEIEVLYREGDEASTPSTVLSKIWHPT